MRRWLPIIVNLTAWDVVWSAAVFGAAYGSAWLGPLAGAVSLAWHSKAGLIRERALGALLIGATIGAASDGALLLSGVVRFVDQSTPDALIALWFFALWANFGTMLFVALRWMWGRPIIGALLGLVGGPLAYFGGHAIGAIELAPPIGPTLALVAAQYGVLIPAWGWAARWWLTPRPGVLRPPGAGA